MTTTIHRLLLCGTPNADREALRQLVADAGYTVTLADSNDDALHQLQSDPPDLLLLSATGSCNETIAVAKSQNPSTRLIVLSQGTPEERARALDLGADDVLPLPWTESELLARLRAQLRQHELLRGLEAKSRIAEESFGVAQTAFQALAVTEKMTRDAFSLERILKIGVLSLIAIALVISGIFFLFPAAPIKKPSALMASSRSSNTACKVKRNSSPRPANSAKTRPMRT